MVLVGPGLGSGISSDSGGKMGLSDAGKNMLDYDYSYMKHSKKLFGIKTIVAVVLTIGIIIILF